MLSQETLKKTIAKSEAEFETCWKYLTEIKSAKIKNPDCITEFQPTLASALHQLDNYYRKAHQEKRRLIKRKSKLNEAWFRKRMKNLSSYQEAIKKTIAIGKNLGDAFAWFFYQNSRNYISQHLENEEIFHSPPGIGGIAELEFIRQVKFVRGLLILYHGTTSFLRLGDISLINLNKLKVVAIGELKSRAKDSRTLDINVTISSPYQNPFGKINSTTTASLGEKLDDKIEARLKRQLKTISSSFGALTKKPDITKKFTQHSYTFEKLEQAILSAKKDTPSYTKATSGLLLVSFLLGKRSIYNRITSPDNTTILNNLSNITENVETIINSRPDNSIFVGSFHLSTQERPKHYPGMTHPFWWPMSESALKSLFFKEVCIFTLFNPSFLLEKIENMGFTIEQKEKNYLARKKIDNKIMELHGMHHYFHMITQYMFTEDGIAKALQTVSKTQIMNLPAKIEVNIQQHM